MKINPTAILRDHFHTLRDARTGKISIVDIFIFYILPVALGLLTCARDTSVNRDVYNLSITFYGIFVALLLNIQVAIFAILQRKRDPAAGRKAVEQQRKKLELRRELLAEVNANISYLVLFSCVSLFVFLSFFMLSDEFTFSPAFTWSIYIHFFLVLLMIVKRSHALFQSEYGDDVL